MRHRSGRLGNGGPVRDMQTTPPSLQTPGGGQELPVPQAAHGLRGPVQEDALRSRVEAAQERNPMPPVTPCYHGKHYNMQLTYDFCFLRFSARVMVSQNQSLKFE